MHLPLFRTNPHSKSPRPSRLRQLATLTTGIALMATLSTGYPGSLSSAYTNPSYQTGIPFGDHSHWIQPWRGYLETVAASQFLNGIGVNFGGYDVNVNGYENPDLVMQHLSKYGVKAARIEIGWGDLDWNDALTGFYANWYTSVLQACKKWGIRPTILLNSNSGMPCPLGRWNVTATATAGAGSTALQVSDTSGIVPGYTGVSDLTEWWAAEAIVTNVTANTIYLSKPLPNTIQSGATVSLAILKYRPFSPVGTNDYNNTVAAWNRYVQVISQFAAAILGTGGFDVEVWNELTFGSHFLNINDYYGTPLYSGFDGSTIYTALPQAVAATLSAQSAFGSVGIADGFANTMPWPASSTEPARVNAISKHPYPRLLTYPANDPGGWMINALLQVENTSFVPSYYASFPEYYGTANQTEHVLRDMSPITTDIYGVNHGRNARVINGQVVPCAAWITEIGWNPSENGITDTATALKLKAKTTARFLCFYLGKGAQKVMIYNTDAGDLSWGIALDAFNAYAVTNTVYPANDSGYVSPALLVTQRIVNAMRYQLDGNLTNTRKLQVISVSDTHDHYQYLGDGTAAHPALYDRDVLTILPVQVNANRLVIPYYVMTRNVMQSLAPEPFTITLGGVNPATAKVSAFDPINNVAVPVTVSAGTNGALTLGVTATDYPYLLTISD
jgi:hypothetical protein